MNIASGQWWRTAVRAEHEGARGRRLLPGGRRVPMALGLAAVLSGWLAVPVSASASARTSPVVGHVYVNDNTAGMNTIGGFRPARGWEPHCRGRFPVRRRWKGTGARLASQGAIQIDAGQPVHRRGRCGQ